MRNFFPIIFFFISITNLSAQNLSLPIVLSTGGEGKNKVYVKLTKQDREKMNGYVWNDCDNCLSTNDCNIRSSSNLQTQGAVNYFAKNLQDDDPMTAWVEGDSDYGIGEYIEAKNVILMSTINILNGYQKSPKSFNENSRIKSLILSENGIARCILRLKDEMGEQSFSVEELGLKTNRNGKSISILRFTIIEVYPGTKFKDVAISELFSGGCCISGQSKINLLNNKEKNIEDLIINDTIKLIDHNNNIIYAFGAELGSVIYNNVLEIITEHGNSIVVSSNHYIYSGSINNKIQARQLRVFDSLLINNVNKGLYLDKISKINEIYKPTKTYYFKKLDFGVQEIKWPIRAIFNNIITADEYIDKRNKLNSHK